MHMKILSEKNGPLWLGDDKSGCSKQTKYPRLSSEEEVFQFTVSLVTVKRFLVLL